MQNEKIAVIALIVIIAGALSIYLVSENQEDLINVLFPPTESNGIVVNESFIANGDCIDIQYIGRYATNNTVFDTSYEDVENKISGDPLRVFVTQDPTVSPPSEYQMNYSSSIIEGLMEQLPGLELGKTYSLNIPDEKAYGEKKLSEGITFNSSTFAINSLKPALSLNQTLKVTMINTTGINLEWINIDVEEMFTMPQIILGDLSSPVQEEMIIIPPPYYIWENASSIQSINEDSVTVITTPTSLEAITDNVEQINYGLGQNDIFMIFPDATTATYNDTIISIISEPTAGDTYDYELEYFGQTIQILYTIEAVTTDSINVSMSYDESEDKQYINVNKSYSFDRIYDMTKFYSNIPMIYAESLIGPDIQREGYSLHELAGEDLIFEVYIENIIKTSQKES
jgi:FKBP-type peptidyl-prolyl cis-trans isomerase 2